MDVRFRTYLAELFGTFLFVLVAAGTLCAGYLPASDGRFTSVGGLPLAVALAAGLTLAVVVTATAPLSPGCCNPAVTLALWVAKQIDGTRTAVLLVMQALGALIAGMVVRGLFSEEVLAEARMGSPHLKALLGPDGAITLPALATGAGVEVLAAALVTVAVFATLIDPRAPRLGGLVVGLAQVAAVLFGFHLTGGSANPAWWLGTAPWQLTLGQPALRPLGDHAVYWAGPLVGALAAGLFYTIVLMPDDRK